MRSSNDHRIAHRSSARRIPHADPSGRMANLRVALAEHDRVARTVRNVLGSFCINFHEYSPGVRATRGINSIVRSAIANIIADAGLELCRAPTAFECAKSRGESSRVVDIAGRVGIAGTDIDGKLGL